jgi:hypothetical protein
LIEENKVNNQNVENVVNNQNDINQSFLEHIAVQNDLSSKQNEEYINTLNNISNVNASQLTDLNNEQQNFYKSQNETLSSSLQNLSTVNNSENSKFFERFESNLQVLEEKANAPVVEEPVKDVVPSAEERQLTKLQQEFSNISNVVTNTTLKEQPKEDNSMKEYFMYSLQLQRGMLQLLQQLVDTQQMKRFTESPIKN